VIAAPLPLADLRLDGFDAVHLLHGPAPLVATPRPPARGRLLVLVGPEGGFTAGEVAELKARGARPMSLGTFRLRSETAALCALALARWGGGDDVADGVDSP
jgi:16S rRNA (uracil1498-N3)-methyltransferase